MGKWVIPFSRVSDDTYIGNQLEPLVIVAHHAAGSCWYWVRMPIASR